MSATPLVGLAERLFPFDYSVTGPGNDRSAAVLNAELPFTTFEYPSGQELNGWLLADACVVERAVILRDGRVVIDNTSRPLGVPAQSDSFSGRLSLAELRPHVFTVPDRPDAIPYHWSRLYRPNEPVWGFCLPQSAVDALSDGDYDVELITRRVPATMKVFVHELAGDTEDTVLFNAHNCHPFQANDDISGIVVGIEVMKRLAAMPRRRFSYALMVAPELFGPMFWLEQHGSARAASIVGAVMLKSLGNDRPLRLQESFLGTAPVDRAAHNVFRTRYTSYESGAFRAIYGNDETVFEAPPYAIPSISITRWPFPEYHTDHDTPERLSELRLADAAAAAFDICRALEFDGRYTTVARGLVCLSSHGLYKPVPPVGPNGVDYTSVPGRWNRLMNALPRLLDGQTGLLEIAEQFQLPIDEVHAYVRAWADRGLVR